MTLPFIAVLLRSFPSSNPGTDWTIIPETGGEVSPRFRGKFGRNLAEVRNQAIALMLPGLSGWLTTTMNRVRFARRPHGIVGRYRVTMKPCQVRKGTRALLGTLFRKQ